ncbi:MAG: hypothetical protein LBP95_12695 [Deltaproteobacteria bacterium]|nr:hypothetical protein [Deltaproteobacteria bacterium]
MKGLWPAPPLVLLTLVPLSLVLSLALLSGEAAAQDACRPKSLIPPARPSGPPEPGAAPRGENLPANAEGLVVHGPGEAGGYDDRGGRGTRDGSERERYYHRDDQTSWPGAASDFASGLAAEYLRGPSTRDGGWEPHLEIILEDAEAGAGPESGPDVGEREYERAFESRVLESVLENLEGLAVDSRGLYHLMPREGLPDAGSWLDTPVRAHDGPPSRMTDRGDEEDERPSRPVYSVSEPPRPNQRQAGRRGANSPSSQGRYSTSP